MSKTRALIDTNVLIALEDPGQTGPVAAELSRRCQTGGVSLHIHPAMREDFARDRNEVRRSVSASRMEKYPCLASIPLRSSDVLEAQFGPIRNENDRVDVQLLQALSLNATDILISQDEGIHKRVRGTALEERVLTIADAVSWLKALQDAIDDGVAFVDDVPAYGVDPADPIFASLQADYGTFTEWWRTKCVAEHRACWVLRGRDGLIDGLIVRKTEDGSELGLTSSAKILKLCTFKVGSRAQGHKVGELLLRKAIWHAQLNGFDAMYLTTFPKQTMLIDLLIRYGFTKHGENASGELILAKHLPREALAAPDEKDAAHIVRTRYPRFSVADPVTLFAIPMQWRFHRQLFPEAAKLVPTPLFNDDTIDDREAGRVPGNTIRKVYVCRSKIKSMRAGDLLFFYQSKEEVAQHSQMLTTVGVVEQLRRAVGEAELLRLTAGRSVYSRQDLEAMAAASPGGLAVIDFLFIRHLGPPISLQEMIASGASQSAAAIHHPDRSCGARGNPPVDEFRVCTLNAAPVIAMLGLSGSGKSYLAKNIARARPDLLRLTAGGLLRRSFHTTGEKLRTAQSESVRDNQFELANALANERAGQLDRPVLLEAHAFIDNDRELVDVPTVVMASLDLAAALLHK